MEDTGIVFVAGRVSFPSGNELLYVKGWKEHFTAPVALVIIFDRCYLIVSDESTGCWLVARELTEEC